MAVRIKNSLAGLLSNTCKENNGSNSSSKTAKRDIKRYKRFNAVSSFGNLDALAEAAAQTYTQGEAHFGQTLSRVKTKSKQGKRRVELQQQRFAWQEEQKLLNKEMHTLELEIANAAKKLATLGLSAPLDELTICDTDFKQEHQPRTKSQLKSLRQMVQTIDPYEAATVLSEVNEANGFIYAAMEQERAQLECACRAARNSVYQALHLSAEENLHPFAAGGVPQKTRNSQWSNRTMLWEKISSIPHAKEIQNAGSLNECFNTLSTHLDHHLLKMKKMRMQLRTLTAVNQQDRAKTTETTPSTVGGWVLDDHQMFVKNWKECIDRGKGHGQFRKRMALLLPHVSRDALSEHVSWFQKHRYLHRQMKEEIVRWERSVNEMLHDIASTVETIYIQEKETEQWQTELKKSQEKSGALHVKLNEMRRIYEQKQKKEHSEQQRINRLKEQERMAMFEMDQKRRMVEKEHIHDFQQTKSRALKQEQEKKTQELQLLKEMNLAKAPVREARIEHRRHVLAQREEEKKSTMAANERAKEEIQLSLEKLKTQCLYFEKIQDIKENQDPKHVLQVTRAFDAAVKELQALRLAGFGVHSRGHAPLNGFQSKTIVGDIRFKLVEQLRSAGLQATPCKYVVVLFVVAEIVT